MADALSPGQAASSRAGSPAGVGALHVLKDAESVSRAGADQFLQRAEAALGQGGRFRVALAGGSTPRRLYELLAVPSQDARVDWSRVDFFWGDERAVPPDHPDSNYRMACEAWLATLAPAPERLHRMEGERADLAAAARSYQHEIAASFGVDPDGAPPVFDLVLLGLGADAHTASLFPGSPALTEERAWVLANPVPKLGTERLTLTAPLLNRAAAVIFLVAGSDKDSALATVLEGPFEPCGHPAQLIRPDPGELVWLVDLPAAAGLPEYATRQRGEEARCP